MDLELSTDAWLAGGYTAEDSDCPSPTPNLTQNPSVASSSAGHCFDNQMLIASFKIKNLIPQLCSLPRLFCNSALLGLVLLCSKALGTYHTSLDANWFYISHAAIQHTRL